MGEQEVRTALEIHAFDSEDEEGGSRGAGMQVRLGPKDSRAASYWSLRLENHFVIGMDIRFRW